MPVQKANEAQAEAFCGFFAPSERPIAEAAPMPKRLAMAVMKRKGGNARRTAATWAGSPSWPT
jgi:hypothetical protein